MIFLNFLKNSLAILRGNKQRTFLTMLGIIIGVSAVIVIMSVGAGAQSLILNQINSMGSNLIGILPGYSDEKGPPAAVMGISVTTLKAEDGEKLRTIPEITAVTSYARGIDTVQWQNQKVDATYVGTTAEYVDAEDVELETGNFFSAADDKGITRVAVLGWQVWRDLFGEQNPIGEQIKIKRETFRVIGVAAKRGVEGFQNQDNLVFIPLGAAQKLLLGINHVSMIRVKVADEKEINNVISQIKQIIREEHKISGSEDDDFSVRSTVQALDTLKTITDALTLFLAAIAAISLLVGGIGIMNIMLISVNERTREIGLRKAVGATGANVQAQFLLEAAFLTLAGGIIGIVLGSSISGLIAGGAHYLGYAWDFVISPLSIFLGVGVSGLIGLIFGWYPARRAAGFDPVVALRYE